MNYIKKGWNWLITSSADPEKVSLTFKGIVTGLATGLTILLGVAHINVGSQLTTLVDATVSFVQQVLVVISIGVTIVGLVRKLWITIQGQKPTLGA